MAISMMEAYAIELLKAHPYTFEQIKYYLENDEVHILKKNYDLDFELLQNLFKENPQKVEQAFAGNYKVKFVTMNGLKNLLRMRFQITEQHYELLESGNGLHQLQVSSNIEKEIQKMLSSNWKLERNGNSITLYV